MKIGTQIHAPDGYANLIEQTTYHFLHSSPQRVLLVRFLQGEATVRQLNSKSRPTKLASPEPVVEIIEMPRELFEDGLDHAIEPLSVQATLPPWLSGVEEENLTGLDGTRRTAKVLHQDRIDAKLSVIQPILPSVPSLFAAADFEVALRELIRAHKGTKNATRVRLWLFTYLVFGGNRNALHYPIHRLGRWDRLEHSSAVKRGRPHRYGKGYGYNTDNTMLEKIKRGYIKCSGIGVTMENIYTESMRIEFGCKTRVTRRNGREFKELFHPKGTPFPQKGTFVYHVKQEFGRDVVKEVQIGKMRARAQIEPIVGSFTERVWNVNQVAEYDATSVVERPKGYVEGSTLPPLYEAVGRDNASGAIVAIGFSQNGEKASAYRMAMFTQAIEKPLLGRLVGLEITTDMWPCVGVAATVVVDRGPGRSSGGGAAPQVKELTVAGRGQSKGGVETSHDKHATDDEAPHYVQSTLTTVQLMRKRILERLTFNETQNVVRRVPEDLLDKVPRPTPNALYKVLDRLGRNDAVTMCFADAVRTYLDKHEAVLSRHGIEFHGRIYRSPKLESLGVHATVPGNVVKKVAVYVFEPSTRFIWLDWDRKLIELDLYLRVAAQEETKYMSLAEIKQTEQLRKEMSRDHAGHRTAVELEKRNSFEEQTGDKWNSGKRRTGRPTTKTRDAIRETSEARTDATKLKKAA